MNSIIIQDVTNVPEAESLIEVDEYVPLRYRTYTGLLGAKYIRIGDYSSNLLEIIIDPFSNVVRGLTLTAFKAFSKWPLIKHAKTVEGLPIVLVDFLGRQSIDICKEFHVSLNDGELILYWGEMNELTKVITHKSNRFFVKENELIGIAISGLSSSSVVALRSHAK